MSYCPTGKHRYESQDEAKRALRRLKGNGIAKSPAKLKCYRCKACGWWHIGNAKWWVRALLRNGASDANQEVKP